MKRLMLLLSLAAFGLGCTPKTLEDNWGRSQAHNRGAMVVNPQPWNDVEREVGIDGQTGEQVMENYRHDQDPKNKIPQLPSIINIGR